jgi:hypothetical protein
MVKMVLSSGGEHRRNGLVQGTAQLHNTCAA